MPDTQNDAPTLFIIDPDRLYTVWSSREIFNGLSTGGSYVPNPDDMVHDWDQGFFRVAGVDYTTGLSDLRPWTININPTEISNEDILLGSGPGYQSEMWRVYLDTRKIPHLFQVDGRLHIYGSAAQYVKIFLGTDVSINGQVISAFYDQNNTFLGENIPLELVGTETIDNIAIKAPMTGFTNLSLDDGEVVTVVVYSANGSVVSKAKMLIDNTSLVRRTDASKKYVTGIRLESPFLSEADPALIEFPINVTIATVAMIGVVMYSDGSEVRMPISADGSTRFTLFGLNHYVPTIEGQTVPLTLNYVLAADEYAFIQGPTANESITERYRAKTIKADNSYSVKLFVYPVWKDSINGYTLDFWLYNLDRLEYFRVPKNLVEVTAGARNFDGLDFLTVQKLSLSVNLGAIDAKYSSYRHTQTFNVSLKAPGTDRLTNWTINFNPSEIDEFGEGLEAKLTFINTNNWLLNIGNDYNSKEEWLRHLFYATQPLYDTFSEIEAPAPNYFAVRSKLRRTEYSIEQWNSDLTFLNDMLEGETIFIEWIRRTPTTDLQLGVTGLPIHQTT